MIYSHVCYNIFYFLKFLFLQIEFILGHFPIKWLLISFMSWLCIWNHNYKHIIISKSQPIKMFNFHFLDYHIPIQITVCIFSSLFRSYCYHFINFFNNCMYLSDSNSPNLYIISWLYISPTYFSELFINRVVYNPAKLRIVIQIW